MKAAMPGAEIGYDQITAAVNIVSTTEATPTTIISCAAHTFDGAPVIAQFWAPYVQNGSVVSSVTVSLWEGVTQIGRLAFLSLGSSGQEAISIPGLLRFTPTAASHTYTVTAFASSTTGTPQIGAGAGGANAYPPAFVRFTKV